MDADADESELRSRLALVQERLDRYTLRLTAGYGTEGDRAHWLGWLRQLRAQRDALERALAAADDPAGAGDGLAADPGDPR